MAPRRHTQSQVMAQPVTSLAEAGHRSWVDVHAAITKTGTVNVDSCRSFLCVIDDGTGQADVVFLGRPDVRGLHVGVGCHVTGRLSIRDGRPILWNPRYELELRGDGRKLVASTSTRFLEPPGEESGGGKGHLRVYLGMAAGVGKTYAMLSDARRRVIGGGDVIVGFVTTHERPETERLLGDLEIVPPKLVDYHGAHFKEMDLDAILARHPDIALIDELAHTNTPGSGRNAKRWQDVLELLDANVDVITTVNVQHIQSLADAAEQITGSPVRERVPDLVLRQAEHIELVDSSPEKLRARMQRGKIYPPDRVQRALDGFFCTENLTALRELTLRFMADETSEPPQLRPYQPLGQNTESVLVGVTGAAGSVVVLHRAAWIAARLKAQLHVAHATPTVGPRGDSHDLAGVRELAEQLGARWIDIEADDPVAALMGLARERQVTQIVVGPSQRNRWQEFVGGGSTVRRLTRQAGKAGIDIHVIVPREPGSDADAVRTPSRNE